jgi:hypothetical protein
MSIFARLSGKYIGVEPGHWEVYANRPAGGPWEELKITKHERWSDILAVAANRQICVGESTRQLETRTAGEIDGWGGQWAISADGKTATCDQWTLALEGYHVVTPLHLEQRGNHFVDAGGNRIVYPAVDQFFAFRQWRDGGPDALMPAVEESHRLGFTCWRMWAQGSKAQNTVADLSPKEAGYYDDVRPCTDFLNAQGIVPLWTAWIDNQDVKSTTAHWYALGERLVGSAALMSEANQHEKNAQGIDIYSVGSPGAGIIWSRGSSVTLDKQTPPRGAPASEIHPTQISFERALMDSTASPINMREVNGSTLVWMTEGHPFGDGNAYSTFQAWQLARGYSIDWGLAVFHNRQSQRMQLMHDDTAAAGAAWVKGMTL